MGDPTAGRIWVGAAGLVAAATSLTCAQRTGTDSTLTQCAVLPVVNVASILILVCFHCPQVLVKKSLPDMRHCHHTNNRLCSKKRCAYVDLKVSDKDFFFFSPKPFNLFDNTVMFSMQWSVIVNVHWPDTEMDVNNRYVYKGHDVSHVFNYYVWTAFHKTNIGSF